MSTYRAKLTVEKYNTTLGEYENPDISELDLIPVQVFEGSDVALVAGVGKVLANMTGTYFIHVTSDDSTAVMDVTVGTQTLDWKEQITTVLSGNSVFIDADKNCNITFKAYKLS